MSDGHSDGFLLEEVHPRVCVCRDQLGRAIHVGDWVWYSGWGADIIRAQVLGFGSNRDLLPIHDIRGSTIIGDPARYYLVLSDRQELHLEGPLGALSNMVVLC